MTLDEVEDRLRKKFLYKECRHKHHLGGEETTYDGDGNPTVTVVAGQEFKKVINVKMTYGPPSGWYWGARLIFDDGTISGDFARMKDIEVKE